MVLSFAISPELNFLGWDAVHVYGYIDGVSYLRENRAQAHIRHVYNRLCKVMQIAPDGGVAISRRG